MNKLIIKSIDQIDQVAEAFLALTKDYTVIAFNGEMGVGKTTFIKAVCKQLQVIDVVTSPTFAIINEYNTSTNSKIFHFDLYRLKDLEELQNIGAEDYLYSGNMCLIEWPEIAASILPESTISVSITETKSGTREITW